MDDVEEIKSSTEVIDRDLVELDVKERSVYFGIDVTVEQDGKRFSYKEHASVPKSSIIHVHVIETNTKELGLIYNFEIVLGVNGYPKVDGLTRQKSMLDKLMDLV